MSDKQLEETVIRIFSKLESRIEEVRETFNKELENVTKKQIVLKSIITKMKVTLERIKIKLTNTGE